MKTLARTLLGLAALTSFAVAGAQTTLSSPPERERVMLWDGLGTELSVLSGLNLGVSAPLGQAGGVQNRPQGSPSNSTGKSPGTPHEQKVDFNAVQRRVQQLEAQRRLALPVTVAILLPVLIGSLSLAGVLKARSRRWQAKRLDW